MTQIDWMNIFLFIFSGAAAGGGIGSAISARNSGRHAKESAEAAATSARIALFEKKGHRTGMKRWIYLYPNLMSREDFMKLFERVLGATGNSPLGASNLLEVYKKEGIIP